MPISVFASSFMKTSKPRKRLEINQLRVLAAACLLCPFYLPFYLPFYSLNRAAHCRYFVDFVYSSPLD